MLIRWNFDAFEELAQVVSGAVFDLAGGGLERPAKFT